MTVDRTLVAADYETACLLADGQFFGDGATNQYLGNYASYSDPGLQQQQTLTKLQSLNFLPQELFNALPTEDDPRYAEQVRQLNSIAVAWQVLEKGGSVSLIGVEKSFRDILTQDRNWDLKLQSEELRLGGKAARSRPEMTDADFPNILLKDTAIDKKKYKLNQWIKGRNYSDYALYADTSDKAEAYYQLYLGGLTQAQVKERFNIDISKFDDAHLYSGDQKYTELAANKLLAHGIDDTKYQKLMRQAVDHPDTLKSILTGNATEVFHNFVQQQLNTGVPAGLQHTLATKIKERNTARQALINRRSEIIKELGVNDDSQLSSEHKRQIDHQLATEQNAHQNAAAAVIDIESQLNEYSKYGQEFGDRKRLPKNVRDAVNQLAERERLQREQAQQTRERQQRLRQQPPPPAPPRRAKPVPPSHPLSNVQGRGRTVYDQTDVRAAGMDTNFQEDASLSNIQTTRGRHANHTGNTQTRGRAVYDPDTVKVNPPTPAQAMGSGGSNSNDASVYLATSTSHQGTMATITNEQHQQAMNKIHEKVESKKNEKKQQIQEQQQEINKNDQPTLDQ